MRKLLVSTLCAVSLASLANAQAPYNESRNYGAPVLPSANTTVNTAILNLNPTYNMIAGRDYYLEGIVEVQPGHTLTIDSGVVVRGIGGFGSEVSGLIVLPGAKIYANGTEKKPVIFTALTDNIRDPYDLGPSARGIWGGVIICGKAGLHTAAQATVEGMPSNVGPYLYGGSNDDDTSGVLNYVSIRHAGSCISSNNEINGLTLCGVGRSTKIEHIEVYANEDDGIEIFGGAVNVKWASVSFCDDDAFDLDQGWVGKGQYWFSIYNEFGSRLGTPDNFGMEADGRDATTDPVLRISNPKIANFTFVGDGRNARNDGFYLTQGRYAITCKEQYSGQHKNGIVISGRNKAVRVSSSWAAGDADDEWQAGRLSYKKVLFSNFGATGANTVIDSLVADQNGVYQKYIADSLTAWGCSVVPNTTSLLRSVARYANCDGQLDPRPLPGAATAAANFDAVPFPGDAWFDNVSFAGAFGPNAFGAQGLWVRGWTALSANRILTKLLDINPTDHEMTQNAGMNLDLAFLYKVTPSETYPDSFRVRINGIDVTPQFTAMNTNVPLNYGTATTLGSLFRISSLTYASFASISAQPFRGFHQLTATFYNHNGTVLSDTATYRLLQ